MGKDRKKRSESQRCYITQAMSAAVFVAIVEFFFPNATPFSYFEFWKPSGTVLEWLFVALPIFAWGVGATAWQAFRTYNDPQDNRHAEKVLSGGFRISLQAGVMEEIAFRWLIFLNAIIVLKISNFLFFGWLGFGLAEFVQNWIAGPVANFFTLGYLSEILTNPENWAVGAGMLMANAFFRDGHKYQGPIGFINSWFLGMYFFYLMFTYGLLAAILIHFLYDLLIFLVIYVDMVIERSAEKRGR